MSCEKIVKVIRLLCAGLKAVVWTDTLQLMLMCGAIVCVILLGLAETGGLTHVLETADEGGRIIIFK